MIFIVGHRIEALAQGQETIGVKDTRIAVVGDFRLDRISSGFRGDRIGLDGIEEQTR